MLYFLDTEFIENGQTIDLISIGIISDDGREYYAINKNYNFIEADKWVRENVLKPIGLDYGLLEKFELNLESGLFEKLESKRNETLTEREKLYKQNKKYIKSKTFIKEEILKFLGYCNGLFFPPQKIDAPIIIERESDKPEFWADYCSYDWVVFCQLFGTMMDLPKGFPMYCNDIQQLWRTKGCPQLPKQKTTEHNALEDAKYVKTLYEFLTNIKKKKKIEVLFSSIFFYYF